MWLWPEGGLVLVAGSWPQRVGAGAKRGREKCLIAAKEGETEGGR